MGDSAREISNLIYTYAELIDAGDFDSVGELFAHGRICGVENGPPGTVFDGPVRVREMYRSVVRLYEDGTPKTHHNTSNVRLDIDEDAGTARAASYYCVTQATPSCRCRSSSPATTTTPSTASTAGGGSTRGRCSSTRPVISASTSGVAEPVPEPRPCRAMSGEKR